MGDSAHIYLEELEGRKPTNQDGALDHALIPRFQTRTPEGAYDFQINFAGNMFPYQAYRVPGYGSTFKNTVRKMQPGFLMLGGFGKVEARPENRVTVDADAKDAFGIPIPVVRFRFGDLDKAVYRSLRQTNDEICSRLKGTVTKTLEKDPGGFASHEVGTARMGPDPKTSVLNGFCQSHDVKNLFVTDGSCFTTSSEKNPTLTIMALSLRASDYIQEQRRKGEL
jgi:choline dehydrogenase-like flavoprotein